MHQHCDPCTPAQAQDVTPQGEAAIRAYHLHTLPAILIVDPITGEGRRG